MMLTKDDIEAIEENYGSDLYFVMCCYWVERDEEALDQMEEDIPSNEVMQYIMWYWEWRRMQFDTGYVDPVIAWCRRWQ